MALIGQNSQTSSLPNFASLTTIKLTSANFPLWEKQLTSYLKANHLFEFVDGSKPSPAETSPEYLEWSTKDSLVSAILTSSLTEPVMVQVLECTTALATWTRLHGMFAAQSNAQIVQSRLQLATLKKGSESISDYYNRAKGLAAAIQAAGQVLPDDEFIVFLFAGLGSEYDSVVTSLSTQLVLPSPEQKSDALWSLKESHEEAKDGAAGGKPTFRHSSFQIKL